MVTQKGTLFVLTGPSGVGKGTLLKGVLAEMDNLFLSTSATTRQPREGEEHGVHYFFLSEEEFIRKIEAGEFLEHAVFNDNHYGTPQAPIDEQLEQGKNVILEIEVQGAMQVKQIRPDASMLFVVPPDFETLASRLRGRGTEDEKTVQNRLDIAKWELQQTDQFDYLVLNDEIGRATEELKNILTAECCRTSHRSFTL